MTLKFSPAIFLILLLSTTATLYLLDTTIASRMASAPEPTVRKYTLVAQDTRIQVDPWNFWNAWTFNGTIPGPTLRANVGDTLIVTLINKQAGVHSLHFHESGYLQAYDGSFLGAPLGMVTTGMNFTYVIKAERPGLFYYHCHSNYVYPITIHIHQGLYGVLIVDDPSNPLPPAKEFVMVLSETLVPDNFVVRTFEPVVRYTSLLASSETTHHIINGESYPFTPTLTARTGERVRLYIVNMGEFQHSIHIHNHGLYVYKQIDQGKGFKTVLEAVPGDVLSLDPGEVATTDLIAGVPGLWMYHSHTVSQGEMGMLGIFKVEA